MQNEEYPKVLFITPCAFNKVTGGGITFSNLFSGWPKDNIATVHNDLVAVSDDVCSNYYELSFEEISKIWPFNYFVSPVNTIKAQSKKPEKSLFSMGSCVRAIIGEAGIPDKGTLSESLEKWISNYKPDVIYTILGTIGFIELVEKIRDKFDIPLVIHLMDDGVTDPQKRGVFAGFIRGKYNKKFRKLLSKADVRMGICEEMCASYEKRYGYKFFSFQNAVNIEKFFAYSKKNFDITDKVKLVYTGSILPYAQLEGIRDFCSVVKELKNEGLNITLDIYTPLCLFEKEVFDIAEKGVINIYDTIKDDEIYFKILQDADILILPVNFDEHSIQYIKYSMPTKVPSYLISATPIIVYGPMGVAQVEYASKYGWGHIVSKRDMALLKNAIKEVISNKDLREKLSQNAVISANKNHNINKVKNEFQKMLIEAVKPK